MVQAQDFDERKQGLVFPAGLAVPDAEILIDRALKRARRGNFSNLSFVRPLNVLLSAYAHEADLSSFGRRAACYDVDRCLANLLQLDAAEEEDASILVRPIETPVFITGMPRSATSFLHMLLSLDPGNIVPRCWQSIYPYPARNRVLPLDLRKARVGLELWLFKWMAPGLNSLHHLSADAPQECTDITAQVFQSLRFENTHHIPSYQTWLDQHGHREAFLFHRRFLQHLDAQMPGRRWVLKSPDHIFALDDIRAVYPDAKFVFLHRDPVEVVSSCVKLAELLRRPFTHRHDPLEVGRQVSARLVQAADQMVRATRRMPDILHFSYREVVANPMSAVHTLYRHCGFNLSEIARRRMEAYLHQPRRSVPRRYDLSEFGLDAASLREQFAVYKRHFALPKSAAL